MSDPVAASLPHVVASLRGRSLTAVQLVEAAVARHERFGERLHAYALWCGEAALAAARTADERLDAGDAPPLTGVPISVKDLYGVEGLPTFSGTRRQLPEKWSRDAWLVARLREQGAIFVGKTHMVEMAFGGVGINPNWGTPYNPWDADTHRVPGGSSSGAGVSLLEGSALLALGSDTGGSIRIPAALTGTVGPRTTKGRWPTDGVVPLSHTFDTVGALARTVEDYVWFFGSVDPAWGDPTALLDELSGVQLSGLRLAYPECGIWNECQPDIRRVIEGALGELRAEGVELRETEGGLLDEAFRLSMGGRPIASTECLEFLQTELPGWLDILHPIVGTRMRRGLTPDAPGYLEALADARTLAGRAADLFEEADILVLPANIVTPHEVAEMEDLDAYHAANAAILRPTYPISILGLCAISVPVGLDDAGMPVGLQLVARGGRDEELLGAALAVERALGTRRERLGVPSMLG